MTRATLSILLATVCAAVAGAFAAPAGALGGPDTCPVGFGLSAPPDPELQRLADRNGDGRVCAKTTAVAGRVALAVRRGPNALRPSPRDCPSCGVVLTDNYGAVGNPDECLAPFAADDALGYGQLDRNRDGVLCSASAGGTLVLHDNAKGLS